MLDNINLAANKFFSKLYSNDFTFKIYPIKGYLTTNVYKVDVFVKGLVESYFVKESSDLNNKKFNDFIKNEYINTAYISDKFISDEKLNIVRPIKYYSDYNLFFMREIKGVRLDKVMKDLVYSFKICQFKFVISLCRQWLDRFHDVKFSSDINLKDFRVSEIKKIEFIKNRSFQNVRNSDYKELLLMYQKMESLLHSLEVPEYVFAYKHNDFAPWNILFDGEGITVYDFADIKVDCKYYDLIYFVHSIEKVFRYFPFKNSVLKIVKSEMFKDISVNENLFNYYSLYFYLQDIELYLRKMKDKGVKKYLYIVLYKLTIFKIKKL